MVGRQLMLVAALAVGSVFLAPSAACATAVNITVFGPLGPNSSVTDSTVVAAMSIIVGKLSKCPGFQAQGTSSNPTFGTEDIDAFVSASPATLPATTSSAAASADTTAAPKIIQQMTVVLVSASTHEKLASQPPAFTATEASQQDFCTQLASSQQRITSIDTVKFFDVISDSDGDRAFADVLIYQLRRVGFDGRLATVNFDQAQSIVGGMCGSNRGILRYHVIQTNSEKKALGATQIATAVAGSVLRCGLSPVSLDTLAAPAQIESHYISVGTLVSSLVGLAVTLKPKISTPQLTSAVPLFSGLVNTSDSLGLSNQQAASTAFAMMLNTYCGEAAHGCQVLPLPNKRRGLFNLGSLFQ